jgi:hypothetical protein
MTDSSKERFRRLLPYFDGSLRFAVFNCFEYDRQKARRRIIREFGKEAYDKEVKPCISDGIMGMFSHKPTRIRRRFMWYVAFAAERRHGLKR